MRRSKQKFRWDQIGSRVESENEIKEAFEFHNKSSMFKPQSSKQDWFNYLVFRSTRVEDFSIIVSEGLETIFSLSLLIPSNTNLMLKDQISLIESKLRSRKVLR